MIAFFVIHTLFSPLFWLDVEDPVEYCEAPGDDGSARWKEPGFLNNWVW